jgi:hypothetical protein
MLQEISEFDANLDPPFISPAASSSSRLFIIIYTTKQMPFCPPSSSLHVVFQMKIIAPKK